MATSPDDFIFNCSDSELAALIRASPRLEQHSGIVLLSDRYLAKGYDPASVEDAIEAVEVAHKLGIRAPRMMRSVRCGDTIFAIMERIQGHTLEDTWLRLGWFASCRLALQLRCYILKMRSITSTMAGSLATGDCRSFWLDDHFGLPPKAKYEDISAFLAFWAEFVSIRHELNKSDHRCSSAKGSALLQPTRLVFTHHDLAPRNMLVDVFGEIWLLDWDFAGFYPVYFEYASMNNFMIPQNWGMLSRIRWYFFACIAAGRFEKENRLLRTIRSKFMRFGNGRRSSIEAQATKARRRRVSYSSNSSDSFEQD